MAERRTWRVGFWVEVEVEVEVDTVHRQEAAMVAEAACQWPGTWRPPRPPVVVWGTINDKPVTARIIRSEALMVKEADRG